MKCPTCTDTDLVMTDRQGVEIDYCPKCRGVWLDRGELDKIIERSSQPAPSSKRDDDDDWDDDDKYKYQYGKKKSKTKSIFGEIFDF
ncbi:MAG: zf-TFIIB domain-containing protein [Actinomycetes bacterium]|jgi:Zn-finger nucleic acid-binding protein